MEAYVDRDPRTTDADPASSRRGRAQPRAHDATAAPRAGRLALDAAPASVSAAAPALRAPARPAPAETPARRPERMSRAAFGEGFVAIVVAGVLLLAVAGLAASVTQAGYRLDRAQSALTAERDLHQRLEVAVAKLQSPSRIEQIATSTLGMHRPSRFDTVVPIAVRDAAPPRPHTLTIAIPSVRPLPGSAPAIWDALRGALARIR